MELLKTCTLAVVLNGCVPSYSLEQCSSLEDHQQKKECQILLWRERIAYLEEQIGQEGKLERRGLLRMDLERAYFDGLTYLRRFGDTNDNLYAMSLCIRAQRNDYCLGDFFRTQREGVPAEIRSLCERKGWWSW